MIRQEFITVSQLAQRLMIPKTTAYHLVQSGEIPGAFKVGKHWRLKKAVVDSWIDEQTKPQLVNTEKHVQGSERQNDREKNSRN